MSYAIRAEALVKKYEDTVALDGVDLEVTAGEVVAVLGPNGAGKTTTVRILAGLLRPDAGHATVDGFDVAEDEARVRALVGVGGLSEPTGPIAQAGQAGRAELPERYAEAEAYLSGTEHLVLRGRLLGMSKRDARTRAAELLEFFDLTDAATRPLNAFSGGLRRRLDLAASVVGRPRVVLLDEPTAGLASRARQEIGDLVRRLAADGTTVLFTTESAEEADRLSDRILVLDRGRVVTEGTPEELKRRTGSQTLQVRPTLTGDVDTVHRILTELTGATPERDVSPGLLTVPIADPMLISTLVRRLDGAGIATDELALRLPGLDDALLTLTARPAGDADRAVTAESKVA
ncbi:ATP-binding cassette domain-containing protein [Streptomyces sp. NPDC046712]|uniref:ATP-binding cassette domain-containing protein n=1 Tax=Streptomyces sp. NPDC046712 TaxID=3154802 RepID=UPI0033EA5515